MSNEPSKKEVIVEEHDEEGNLLKRTISLSDGQQSSIEINWDRRGEPAVKIKVYEDNLELLDKRTEEYKRIALKHATRLR